MGGRNPSGPRQHIVLALSGGGPDGAFGAGFLTAGPRAATGHNSRLSPAASAGALMAPFAFIGPSYDELLKNAFYSGDMENLLQFEGVRGMVGTGLFSAEPLRQLIAKYIDADIAGPGRARNISTGRQLFIVTTNLDAQRTAIWDMGRIASSGDPKALELFRNVMEASASIPGVFPPVMIEVEGEASASPRCMLTAVSPPTCWSCRKRCWSPTGRLPSDRAAEILRHPEQQAGSEFRRGESEHAADHDPLVRDFGARQYAQHAACDLEYIKREGLEPESRRDRRYRCRGRRKAAGASTSSICAGCSITAISADRAARCGSLPPADPRPRQTQQVAAQ